jgi:hypothetical protein
MIIKRRAGPGFVQIPNDVVRDKRLALDEHGMLHYLLSLPDDWEVNLRQLEKYWSIGRDRRRRIFRTLRKTGWAQLERLHSDDGAFIGARWIIGDEPGPEASEETLAAEAADDDEAVPENSETATAAPESKGPDVLAPNDHETGLTAVGSPAGRVSHATENTASLRRKTPDEQRDSTNTTETSPLTAKSTSAADDDVGEGEPPPRFGELLKLWPSEHVVSPFACEKSFVKFSARQKLQAFHGVKPYLSDCRSKGHNRLCDLRTYLDERRFERFAEKPAGRQLFHIKRGTPQAERWREHYRHFMPDKLSFFEMMMSQSGMTMETEWPPPIDPLAKTA